MSFSLDAATPWGQARYLIGDTDSTKPNYQDEDLQAFISLAPYNSLYLACALALDGLANKTATKLNKIVLGTLQIDQTSKAEGLRKAADRFRDLEYNTPAWAVVEENLSGFNELAIIKNWVLKTEA